MKFKINHTQRDVNDNPAQWHLGIEGVGLNPRDTTFIVSKFNKNYHVAVCGFGNDASFEFKDSGEPITQQLNKQLLKHSKALRRIIKVVFDET